LEGAREWRGRLQAELDTFVASAPTDDALLRALTRRAPHLLDRLQKARWLVEQLQSRAATLERRVQALVRQRARAFQVCPVDEPRHYIDDYGVVSTNGGWHVHEGIDIYAPKGTPIRAPFNGRAVDATNSVGGLAVTVHGAKGYVYNAHLSRLGKLGPVREGDVVGFVGATGNARGASPHDHFEWHPGGGRAVNPFAALNAAC
jgi:murein DD-endopeptidase MepM/ murein hydrolase activator NlpD